MNKSLIHERFAKHLKDYDKNAKIQKIMAEKLVSLCARRKYKNILEIGCGTGFLTKEIVKNIEFETYTAIDIVQECETFIKKIDENIVFIAKDVEDYSLQNHLPPDLIISNAALQWTNNFAEVVNKLKGYLAPDGEFLFSTFGKENFREMFFILGTSLKYYSIDELRTLLPEFTIYPPEVHIMSFKTPKEILKHIQATGVNSIEKTVWTKSDLKSFEDAYSSLCVKVPTLTYNPVYIKYQTNG